MKQLTLIIFFIFYTEFVYAEKYSAIIRNVNTQLKENQYELNAEIEYGLSPTAKEALHKGISLTWVVIVKVQQQGFFWDSTLKNLEMSYQIQNHALLNLYSVKKLHDGSTAMFSTLAAALNSISKINSLVVIEKNLIDSIDDYHIAIKVLFNREALPVPLRPMSYFSSDWALSSPWSTWQLQN